MKKNKIICTSLEEKYTKGVTPILKDLEESNDNLLVIDNNLNVYNTFKKKLKNKFNIVTLGLTSDNNETNKDLLELVFNLYKEGKISIAFELLNDFSNVIFKDDAIDPFWNESAASLFIGASLYLFKTSDKVTFMDVYNKVDYFYERGKEDLKKYINECNDNEVAMYLDGLIKMPPETKGGVVATFNQKLRNVAFRMKNVNINTDANAFIVCDYTASLSKEARLIYAFLKRMASINNKQLNIVFPSIDTYENMYDFKTELNSGPTTNVRYFLITSSLDYLKEKYSNLIEAVCDVVKA